MTYYPTSLTAPYFSGTEALIEVPGVFDVALNNRGYMLDDLFGANESGQPGWSSIPILRTQADTSNLPGEASLNPEGLWRRSAESWHHGAGQVHFDRQESDASRFRTSKGIDCWTRWQLSLLAATASRRTSVNTNLALMPAGSRLYVIDGAALLFTSDVTVAPTWTTVTGVPATAASSIASDGYNVWTAHGASGIYATTTAANTTASYVTGTASNALVGFVKGRLMVASGTSLYNITAGGALPAALFTPNAGNFTWVGFAEGPNNLYAAGYAGDKSLIYRTAVKSDGTALDAPVVAGELPDGEIVRAIQGYVGYLLIGTDKGIRFASISAAGDLSLGSLITTTSPVRCFEGQERFVWFGWTNYDATSTGLGRLDLQNFTSPTSPAYASDLMATGQGTVTSVATFQNLRVFAVAGLGVYAETTDKVASGSIDSGLVSYGLVDEKVAMFLDVRHSALVGGHEALLSTDGGSFTSVGTSGAGGTADTFDLTQSAGEMFEVRHTLTRSTTATTTGPVLTRWTLRSFPAPNSGEEFVVPLLLSDEVVTRGGTKRSMDVGAELDLIRLLVRDRRPTGYREGAKNFTVRVEDFRWYRRHPSSKPGYRQGTCVVTLKSLEN